MRALRDPHNLRPRRPAILAATLTALALPLTAVVPVTGAAGAAGTGAAERVAAPQPPPKIPTQRGYGGAVSSVDPYASRIGLRVLRHGGNAVDAAVATAAALGVTEPFSAGVGGGGFFVYYDASTGRVRTLDGRETAPREMPRDAFIDPATGEPYNFTPELVTSGVSVGTPGTPATWAQAVRRWGSRSLSEVLSRPARLARRGFVVDETFRNQTEDNQERFEAFRPTKRLYLPGGEPPAVGSVFKNPALADTYRQFGRQGSDFFYRGALPREIVSAVRNPPTTPDTDLPVPPGFLSRQDFGDYGVRTLAPTRTSYRGRQVFGMRGSSSGGIAIGESLNMLENFDLESMDDAGALHHYLEASALAYADRAKYVGDEAFVDVPVNDLLSQSYADERACLIDPEQAADKPVAAGDAQSYDGECEGTQVRGEVPEDTENVSTSHVTTADRWGNVVAYTLTIEQTGGSGIVVPGRGFLLNNELTDFSLVYKAGDPNRIQPGKRPRSSMSPTIVLADGEPVLALGSPGGSTIITTVLQTLVNRFDLGMPLPEALAAPRASQRNTPTVTSEPKFIAAHGPQLSALGHDLVPAGDGLTSDAFIGALAAIKLGPGRRMTAAAEPVRRGGGSARVVEPD